jgi:hypothetical protein
MLAKEAVTCALTLPVNTLGPWLLPFEALAVIINNVKTTPNVAPAIRFALGKVDARQFYTKAIHRVRGSNQGGLGWPEEAFDEVDWTALAQAIKNRSEGFQLWLSKQAIGVCATQKNTARIQNIS